VRKEADTEGCDSGKASQCRRLKLARSWSNGGAHLRFLRSLG